MRLTWWRNPFVALINAACRCSASLNFDTPKARREFGEHKSSLVVILLIRAGLRFYHLGQSSLWYDEVVTMRLARVANPTALLRLLHQIDATRAPLHPLILQVWVSLFGSADSSGRAFSTLCGLITVGLVYLIGYQAFDIKTGLWASWLCSLSPLLVYYSRETRMYMWLVMITCLAWYLLLSFPRSPQRYKLVFYSLSLIAIAYSHPLGLFMLAALGVASIAVWQASDIVLAKMVLYAFVCFRKYRPLAKSIS